MIKLIILPRKFDIGEACEKKYAVGRFFFFWLLNDGDESGLDQAEDFLMIHLCS